MVGTEASAWWHTNFGALLTSAGAPLSAVEGDELRGLLTARGFVLLRGFRGGVGELRALAAGLFDRAMIYGGVRERVADDDTVQTVEPGTFPLQPHCEMAYTPFRPDIAVFHCEAPARDGGETTVVDGVRVHAALRPATRALLAVRRARYVNRVRDAAWQRMYRVTTRDEMAALLPRLGLHAYDFTDAGDLIAEHRGRPLVARARGTAYAESFHNFPDAEPEQWTNGIKKTWIGLDDDPLPADVRAELQAACRAHELPIGWRPGDAAILDNWSVLHGRTAFTDTSRRIYSTFGYASWIRPQPA